MILAIDTATDFAGLALYNDDAIWSEEIWHADRHHTVEMMPRLHRMLDKAALTPAQLEGIAVAIGPGSYTGVRIGVAIAKGLALPHNLSVIGVPTLQITAYPHRRQPLPVVVVARAGRKRILSARYAWEKTAWQETTPAEITTIAQLAATLDEPTLVSGELEAEAVWQLHKEAPARLTVVGPAERIRRPGILAEIGASRLAAGAQDDLDGLVPIYLQDP